MNLANKYKPLTFNAVIGQSIPKTILTHQINTHTVGKAYLFCGGSGTGKSTMARIFGSMLTGDLSTVLELDTATHNSVDEMRELIESARRSPIVGNKRVIILDECHLLSNSAGNVLLKTLEDELPDTIFILCTTNPEKVLPTIRNRTQIMRFVPVDTEAIKSHLINIITSEGYVTLNMHTIVDIISEHANGSVRNAITMLEQVLGLGDSMDNTDNVCNLLGIPNNESISKFAIKTTCTDFNINDIVRDIDNFIKIGSTPSSIAESLFKQYVREAIFNANKDEYKRKLSMTLASKLRQCLFEMKQTSAQRDLLVSYFLEVYEMKRGMI